MKNKFKISLFSLAMLWNVSYAYNNEWRVSVMPFIWDLTMAGNLTVNDNSTHVDESTLGGDLRVSLQKEHIGLEFNTIYSNITRNTTVFFYDAKVTNKFGIFAPHVFFEVYKQPWRVYQYEGHVSLQPYIGGRYTLKETTLRIPELSYEKTHHQHWTDPLVGLNIDIRVVDWILKMSGDVGGRDRSTQYSYSFLILLGYQPNYLGNILGIYAGYQVLDQHYVDKGTNKYFNWNMKLAGPMLGVNFNFN